MNPKKAKALALKSVRRPLGTARKIALAERDPTMMFLGDIDDPCFDDALIGSIELPCNGHVACYDYAKCVSCLMLTNEWDRDTAFERMEFNVVGAYVGPKGPVFYHPLEDE